MSRQIVADVTLHATTCFECRHAVPAFTPCFLKAIQVGRRAYNLLCGDCAGRELRRRAEELRAEHAKGSE